MSVFLSTMIFKFYSNENFKKGKKLRFLKMKIKLSDYNLFFNLPLFTMILKFKLSFFTIKSVIIINVIRRQNSKKNSRIYAI